MLLLNVYLKPEFNKVVSMYQITSSWVTFGKNY